MFFSWFSQSDQPSQSHSTGLDHQSSSSLLTASTLPSTDDLPLTGDHHQSSPSIWGRRTIVVALAFGLQACSSGLQASSTHQTVVLTGSSTVAPLASEIGKRFEQEHPGTRVDVQTGGSSRGIADARQGVADIGMVSRSLKPEESDLTPFAIANDGIAPIVHAENPVTTLTDDQIVGIYTKRIKNWQDVGGQDAPITVVNKAEGRSTLELFAKYFELETPDIKADVVIGDNEQGIKTVAGNVNAIGYVSIGAAEYSESQGTPVKALPIRGVAPSLVTVQDQSFPLSRVLTLVTKTEPEGTAKDFIEFAQSQQVHDIVEEQYFVPLEK